MLLLVPGPGAQIRDVVSTRRSRASTSAGELRHRVAFFQGSSTRRSRAWTPSRRRSCCSLRRRAPRARAIAVEHRAGDRGAADDEHIGRRVAQRLRQRVIFQLRLVDDVAPGTAQSVDPALLEFIRDQDLHASFPVRRSPFCVLACRNEPRTRTTNVEPRTTNHERRTLSD
jgi:hypothetical protein